MSVAAELPPASRPPSSSSSWSWWEQAGQAWWGLDDVPAGAGPRVAAMGVFDGVHRGHAAVVTEAARLARSRGVRSVAVTFHPHPAVVLGRRQEPAALVSVRRRAELLRAAGADDVLVLPFTQELAAEPAECFVQRVLRRGLGCRGVVVGADFRFGAGGTGDLTTLRRTLGPGAAVVGVRPVLRDAERCSSTLARQLAAQGRVDALTDLLGRPHRVEAVPVGVPDALTGGHAAGPARVVVEPLDAGAARLAEGPYRARVLPLGCPAFDVGPVLDGGRGLEVGRGLPVGPVLDVEVVHGAAGMRLLLAGGAWASTQCGSLAIDLLARLDDDDAGARRGHGAPRAVAHRRVVHP
ncbi:riboflavin kinase/FMN adenylyltransferase [Quadrisphaera granulorum]|uniref:FAD synthase n=1 Tax=Quadrisphaera granulorum TaxID=317664 RepID=A0A316ABB2_9ACTN|nr:adenylyltransferase/cytidyltransferase family protein [Quadrisphaera granulorum]PWJ54144.1 riboflavin kinase/FMN adenylyltransferase [Quadrisphaera granulorum]SZE96283.1 riboflavin kinase/FMN adenylyltransferase [Quadrisphaera granulorum]